MSLATRCTSCGTVFRVVQDQLKVSEGWVRCGRCNEVFNALQGLFDLERDTPPEWSPLAGEAPAEVAGPGSADGAQAFAGPADLDSPHDPALVRRIDAQIFGPMLTETDTRAAATGNPEAETTLPSFGSADAAATAREAILVDDTAIDATTATFPPPQDDFSPDFIRHADRRARWKSPGAVIGQWAACLALVVALGLQSARHFHDLAAARWPQAAPLLRQLCAWTGCTIETPRRIDEISVESSALTHGDSQGDLGLSLTLRNRSTMAIALPAVELSLTDLGGQLVARRALNAQDFRAASSVLQPGTELALQTRFAVQGARVSGYTVELFYP